jgi:hypothetical protein
MFVGEQSQAEKRSRGGGDAAPGRGSDLAEIGFVAEGHSRGERGSAVRGGCDPEVLLAENQEQLAIVNRLHKGLVVDGNNATVAMRERLEDRMKASELGLIESVQTDDHSGGSLHVEFHRAPQGRVE